MNNWAPEPSCTLDISVQQMEANHLKMAS